MKSMGIVMTYFNRQKQLDRTLMSIHTQNPTNIQVVIVDDASEEPIKLKKYKFPIHIIRVDPGLKKWTNPEPAYNKGILWLLHNTDCELIMLQNAECMHAGPVLSYAQTRVSYSDYLTFGCFAINKELTMGPDQDLWKKIPKAIEANNYPLQRGQEMGWYNHPAYRRCFYEFCAVMTRDNMIQLNGYDERLAFGIGYGDDFLLHRVTNLGLNLIIVADPFVIHQWHERVGGKNRDNLLWQNKYLFDQLVKQQDIAYRAKHLITEDFDHVKVH